MLHSRRYMYLCGRINESDFDQIVNRGQYMHQLTKNVPFLFESPSAAYYLISSFLIQMDGIIFFQSYSKVPIRTGMMVNPMTLMVKTVCTSYHLELGMTSTVQLIFLTYAINLQVETFLNLRIFNIEISNLKYF